MQPTKICRDGSTKASAWEVEQGEEREITKVRGELSMEGHLRQRQCSDTLLVAAAGDADPAAEIGVGCPAAGKHAERISELCLESQQGSKVGVAAVIVGCIWPFFLNERAQCLFH